MMTDREEKKMEKVRLILKEIELIALGMIKDTSENNKLPHSLDLISDALDAYKKITDDRNKL